MNINNYKFISDLYFYSPMPDIYLEYRDMDELYERAFLSRDDKNDCEYGLNTTCWD